MKKYFLIGVFALFCCFSCKSQDTKHNNEVIGAWEICVRGVDSLEEHPNHCTKIIFFANGSGTLDESEPPSNFNWKVERDMIMFSFESNRDKELFFSTKSEFKLEYSNSERLTMLRLLDDSSNSWFLLSREITKNR